MELLSIELRYLRYFVALAEELNFVRAAKRLRVTGSALSMIIKKLEDILGVRLCERNSHKVQLTAAGRAFLREVRMGIARLQKAVDAAKKAAKDERENLIIGILERFSQNLISEPLSLYRKRFPKVEVTLFDLRIAGEESKVLEEGRVHIGLTYDLKPLNVKGIEYLQIGEMPLYAVMGAQHPLAAQKQVTLKELAGWPLLLMQYKRLNRNLAAIFHKKKLRPRIKKTNSMAACMETLTVGDEITLLPKIPLIARDRRLILRPLKNITPIPQIRVFAIWKKTGVPVHVLNFIDLLRQDIEQRG